MGGGGPTGDGPRGLIGVLGPPVVVTPEGTRSVGGLPGKLLVALTVSEEPAGADRLSEVLWGDDPPPTARSALHVHLGVVRRALGDGPQASSLQRIDGRYRLRPGSWRLDVAVAADHASRAEALLDRDPTGALVACRTALPLWRGPAFTVGGVVVDAVAAQRASALRLELEELLVEALLARGEASAAEQVALRLVEAEPFREVRWAQLLRARYHSGRPRDALLTYQDARRMLAEGLGVDPGPLLRDLERAVLTHDEAALAGRRTPPPTPQLPPPIRRHQLFGRDVELHRCRTAHAARRPVVVHGPPGVGKTALANEIAHRHPSNEVLWIDLRLHGTADEILGELSGDPQQRQAPAWARTGGVELVVFDNAEGVTGPVAEVVERLARVAPDVALLVTSRVRPPVDAVFVPLAPLPVPDATATADEVDRSPAVLVLRAAAADLAPAVELSTSQAADLCRHAGGLPLALRLTAAAARGVPVEELVSESASVVRQGVLPAVEATLALADHESATAFRRLGLLRQGFDAGLAAAVTDLDRDRARAALVGLADLGLVQVAPGERSPYSLVEPVRDAAEQLLHRAGEAPVVQDRLVAWTLERARRLRRAAQSECEAPGAMAAVAREIPWFLRTMDHLVASGDHERGLLLARRLDAPLYLAGRWPERNRLLDLALSIAGPPSADRALVLGLRGRAGPLSALDRPRLEAALAMADRVGAEAIAAYVRHLRGILSWWEGDLDAALRDHRRAAAWFEAEGDPTALEVRKYEGVALVHAGEFTAGAATVRRIAMAYLGEGQKGLYAHGMAYLGHCHRFMGDDDAALADWQQALEVFAVLGNDATAVHVELGLGELAVERGDPVVAARHAGAALQRIARSGNRQYEAWGWTVALRAAAAAGDTERALACARSGMATLGHVIPAEAARLAGELAVLAADIGRWRHAARLLGCAAAHGGRRELPFSSPAEAGRWEAAHAAVTAAIGVHAEQHFTAGSRCSVPEAAGDLILRPGRSGLAPPTHG